MLSAMKSERGQIECFKCGSIGRPKWRKEGSVVTLIFLTMFGILPGLFHAWKRATSARPACSKCGSEAITSDIEEV